MKDSIELKGLLFAAVFSISTLGAAIGGGRVIQKISEPPAPGIQLPKPMTDAGSMADTGRGLFMKNCAHCHGDDARGDEGPDVHGLRRSDDWIARRIRNGVKGEMTAFGEKFSPADIAALTAFLRTLK